MSTINIFNGLPKVEQYEAPAFLLIAGPCAVESRDSVFHIAETIKEICGRLEIPFVFKASYRKANRSRLDSFTGIGDEKALNILAEVAEHFNVPVTTDVHSVAEAKQAARFVDVLQIPAFLCRQTDLIVAAAETGKIVNIKKGQFLAANQMRYARAKATESGAENVWLTERGSSFGYSDLVVDFRGIPEMRETGSPVVLDCTHSLQQPNQSIGVTGGRPEMIQTIASCGIAAGADGLFIETHPDPSKALSDGANMLSLSKLESLLNKLLPLYRLMQR